MMANSINGNYSRIPVDLGKTDSPTSASDVIDIDSEQLINDFFAAPKVDFFATPKSDLGESGNPLVSGEEENNSSSAKPNPASSISPQESFNDRWFYSLFASRLK